MPKSRHSKRRSTRRPKRMGGNSGAAQHAINMYGGIGQQQAGTGNLIALNQGSAVAPAAVVTGGGELQPAVVVSGGGELQHAVYGGENMNKHGGGIITDIAVPAALILSRNIISKRRLPGLPQLSLERKSRRNRRRSSRRRR